MIKRVPILMLLTVVLTVTVIQSFSVMAGTKISVPEMEMSDCIDCTEGVERDSLVGTVDIVGEKEGNAQVEGTSRGLWTWNTDVVTEAATQHEFLIFVQLKDVSDTYLYAPDLLQNNPSELEGFILKADDIGVQVELLAGDPSWTLSATHPVALGFVQQAITFTQNISGVAKPIGIHLDIEPYLLPEWNTDRSGTITQYLDLLNDIRQELITSNAGLIFTVDIPFWYDTITATYKSVSKPLNQHVQDIVDRIVIMDYRDFAEGNDGIIIHAQNEMDYAQSISKEVVIGVETNDVEPEKVTFFEEGATVLENELTIVYQHYQSNSAFCGFAIHDYTGYLALAPIRRFYLPIILKN